MSCREVPEIRRNGEYVGGTAVSCRELQGKGNISGEMGEAAVGCHKVQKFTESGGWEGAAVSCRGVP